MANIKNAQTFSGPVTISSDLVVDATISNSLSCPLVKNTSGLDLESDINITLKSNLLDNINLDAPNVNSYTYAMPICFTRQTTDRFNYTLGNQSFELIYQTSFGIPQQFVSISPMVIPLTSTNWKIDFAFNMYQMTTIDDKGMGIYIDFIDTQGNIYTPITYNDNTPFSINKKDYGYNAGNGPYLPINWTDYVDLATLYNTESSNLPLDMRIYFVADNGLSSKFNMLLTFTRTNIV